MQWAKNHREAVNARNRITSVKYRIKYIDRTRQRFRDNRAWRASLKDKPCVDCGNRFPAVCMDFDHVRGVKEYNVGNMTMMNRDRIIREIEKCDIICSNCHRIRTANRRQQAG